MQIKEISVSHYLQNIDDFPLLLDVRSPIEYQKSHIPQSINLYALDDKERAEVGKLHARTAFEAKLLGASFICKNLSNHLKNFNHTPAKKVAIYCAKGQMRSYSISTVLAAIGFRVYRIIGGYKAYRQEILKFFSTPLKHSFVLLDGPTGSGKSEIIKEFKQSINLEELANHKGSVFGALQTPQPSTAQFENLLFHELLRFNEDEPILLEAESKNIGKVTIPTSFYDEMKKGYRIYLKTPLKDRVNRIVNEYEGISNEQFFSSLKKISRYISKELYDEIALSFNEKNFHKTADLLLEKYYDKAYKKPKKIDEIIESKTMAKSINEIEIIVKREKQSKTTAYFASEKQAF
ncbi:MAG: tRNA 2-selenouridine(34) synthase MnmH [Sulfurospirillaceae bacterium]|nr:tRNA 2-selenouridine(34) synthase MnmH [Sulfurospirillaceae bacterium]MCK9546164.1 tRNA 2-selenouridine(34) synthase MnmH [Sulfurospirillaceae bacterium]MDY0237791.1 tRNA 2-selenouridine(34) synthase MnmH [Campylobacterales bacterium]NLM99429.1 tRNA 2-selenouridine(34) synthase MnmH [Campylobacteraceae bacterium]